MNETNAILADIKEKFGSQISQTNISDEKRVSLIIPREALLEMAEYLHHDVKLRFITASALESKAGFEIYYHFSNDETGLIFNLHVILSGKEPEIQSLTSLFEAANWIEREIHEILGITFPGHPNLEKLISEGNWAEGVYPYRKNY
ncbi:MAG: NADH-quinone oxidoreductase subunit C [Bacteroidales bacterium]|nr:NADH-quinone oxidoreductase subunit C [Bacteroidales bacterium]